MRLRAHWPGITKTHASLLEAKLYRFFECSDVNRMYGDTPALFDLGPLDQQIVDEAYRSFLNLLPFAGLPYALSPLIDAARSELGYFRQQIPSVKMRGRCSPPTHFARVRVPHSPG